MKTRPIKMLGLALTLPLLAGCAILDNIIGGIALNVVFDSEYILNRVSMTSGEAEVGNFTEKPTSAEKRATLTYGLDAIIVPDKVEISQFGFTVKIDFELTFSEGAENLFFVDTMNAEDEGEDGGMAAAAKILYPVGTQTKPESADAIGEWLTIDRLLDLKGETAKDVTVTVKGKSGNKTKSQTFYFALNSSAINLPSGDVDIDTDHALAVTEVGVEKTLDITIPKSSLAAGHEVPLQVMWIDLDNQNAESGTVLVTVEGLGSDYEVVGLGAGLDGPIDITKNETLIEWTHTIKAKPGVVAAADLVVTYKAVVTLGA